MEASYLDLKGRFDDLVKDHELLQSQVNLESDILKGSIFRVSDQLKQQLLNVNERLVRYYATITKMQSTIDIQQKLVGQFQKEKANIMRQKLVLESQFLETKEKLAASEATVRTCNRKISSIRGLARIITENTLGKRSDYSRTFDEISTLFFHSYERYDAAALIIQRIWRRSRNPDFEKGVIRSDVYPSAHLMAVSAIDVIAGNMKPVTYRQIVKLLKSYNLEMRDAAYGPFMRMKNYFSHTHEFMNELSQRLLCRGKQFAWCQTELVLKDVDVQTEKVVSGGHSGRRRG
jgi:hypothetical protein